ncbi:MAG: class I adenylate-forming enzyme family protein [Aristaeellaceae bacterium]
MKQLFDGNLLWPELDLCDMRDVQLGGRCCRLFDGMPHSLYESLRDSARRSPDRICIVDDDGEAYSYAQLEDMVRCFSGQLSRMGARPGDHIAVLLYNSAAFCAAVYAISHLHAVLVPLSTKYKAPELRALCEKSDLDGAIFHEDFADVFEDQPLKLRLKLNGRIPDALLTDAPDAADAAAQLEDDAILMFTSGTTSGSKGVVLKNYNVMHAIAVYQRIFSIDASDRTVLPVPAYHVTGLIAVLGLFVHAGGTVWLHRVFQAERVLRTMAEEKITFFHASPTVLFLLLRQRAGFPSLPSLRIIACGSSNMPPQKIAEYHAWMPEMEFRTVYGLTETSSPATVFPTDAATSAHTGSSGRPVPGVQIKVVGPDDRPLELGEKGSVLIRGSCVTPGYYRTDSPMMRDGWLDTGDIGFFDADGYLTIVDRKKDMINRGGEKICSLDVENALYALPEIAQAAVVGIADEIYGEVPAAMIVLKEGRTISQEEIRRRLLTSLAKYQVPRQMAFTENLPLTPNQKIDKRKIREILTALKEPGL